MGKIWMPGGGGGADLDVVTAGRPDILTGKVIVDKDGEPLTGTMVNRGAVSQTLGVNGTYTIPEGYHNGSGKVTQNIPIQGADVSGTDRAWATNISCWGGVACLGVRNAHYLNGVNWIQGNISNFYAGNIKKGVNMGGLVGTFEGYVPTATDLYLRGNNIAGLTINTNYETLDAGQITVGNDAEHVVIVSMSTSMVGYSKLNVQGYRSNGAAGSAWISYNSTQFGAITNIPTGNYTIAFDVTSAQISASFSLRFGIMKGSIYRIWKS